MPIKHIVLSGGGPSIFKSLGALHALQENGYWRLEDIESIYGTSAGSIIAVTLCMGFEWSVVIEYFLNRPWHDAFQITPTSIFDAYGKKGVFAKEAIEIAFKPLFSAKDIPMNITMKDFHQRYRKDLYMYTFELHTFTTIELSHTTHPDLELLDAIHMSCALPILLAPRCIDSKCYLDGGVFCNYPLRECLDRGNNEDEILGIKNTHDVSQEDTDSKLIGDESTIVDYLNTIISKMIGHLNTICVEPSIKNQIVCRVKKLSFTYIQESITRSDVRKELLEDGAKEAVSFLNTLQSPPTTIRTDN